MLVIPLIVLAEALPKLGKSGVGSGKYLKFVSGLIIFMMIMDKVNLAVCCRNSKQASAFAFRADVKIKFFFHAGNGEANVKN